MRTQPPTKTCELCGERCYGRRHRDCYLRDRWQGRGRESTCGHCRITFRWTASEGTRRFCGWECYWASGVPHTDAWKQAVSAVEFWSKNVERRYDVTNGVTLCVPCHDRRHGRRNAQTPLGLAAS